MSHPYSALPDERYWRKAVASVPPFQLDPSESGRFRLAQTDRIATAGSCFAQQVAKVLRSNGFNFLVTEAPPERRDAGLAAIEGNFSARYGNIYTTRHLLQLMQRAYGTFAPRLVAWERPDGRFVDPFRPAMEPDGFASPDAVAAERDRHLTAVRQLFESLDTFLFTLGLTEGWVHKADGAVLPVPPGVVAGTWDPDGYEPMNATVAEMTVELVAFIDALRAVNPSSQVILTVSPVPIIATMEDRHVLVSNSYTKSALRVVTDEVCRARPDVHYFPSYEIVTSPATAGRYYGDNMRAVNEAGIRHVTRLFLAKASGAAAAPANPSFDTRAENRGASEVLCDEEALDSA